MDKWMNIMIIKFNRIMVIPQLWAQFIFPRAMIDMIHAVIYPSILIRYKPIIFTQWVDKNTITGELILCPESCGDVFFHCWKHLDMLIWHTNKTISGKGHAKFREIFYKQRLAKPSPAFGALINNFIHAKGSGEITHPGPKFNGVSVNST